MRGDKIHIREARDLLRDVEKEFKADMVWLIDFCATFFHKELKAF